MVEPILHAIEEALGAKVTGASRVRGGDVATALRVELEDGRWLFAKTSAAVPQLHFTTEAAGLAWMRSASDVCVPQVVAVSDAPPFLVLEWIEEGRPTDDTDSSLGRGLAALHRAGAASFGRTDRRPTGSRGLPNDPCGTWAEFYATQRLLPLVRLASVTQALDSRTLRGLAAVAERLEELGGEVEPPARLHGDLWAGNRLVGRAGRNWLIDPASHGGHRESDLAMMRLFGGFGPDVFAAYSEVSPLAAGWQDRVALHQLAPLVSHAIKFGGSYPAAVERALGGYL
ncbi:MAG: fructosamine kinase family protein [Acidobacteria bacterium]|nr:fructosamine kinase family protein [Acidobacteriota bacterium]